jgi:arabinogalactan oligomer/maltooligosaccharide transport system permease protein
MNKGRNIFIVAFLLPAVIVMFGVIVYPFIYNIVISLSNMSLRHFRDWRIIGLRQYVKVFSEEIFYSVFFKTLIWTFVNVFFHVVIGVFLALILNKKSLKFKPIFRTLLILLGQFHKL